MGWLTILLFGALHGLQPDHLAAAGALAARTGTSVLAAAMRLAAGHAVALAAFALGAMFLPAGLPGRLEPWADALAGVSLAVIGIAVLLQALRSRYVVHAHEHEHDGEKHEHVHVHPTTATQSHDHGHLRSAIAIGLVLGIGGARSLVILLPAIAGPGSGLAAIGVYCVGIFAGVAGLARLVDIVRGFAASRNATRFLDAAFGLGALVIGGRLLAAGW